MEFKHYSVLKNESLNGLNIKEGGIYVDGTTGGAGHSEEILKRLNSSGKLICIDRDSDALEFAKVKLAKFKNVEFVKDNFFNIKQILKNKKINKIDGMLCDLGLSSYQIDNVSRGFSYSENANLDMRMDKEQSLKASDVVNTYSESELYHIIKTYGEEEFAKNIAKHICIDRAIKPILTSDELKKVIDKSIPARVRFKHGSPYKKTFQALRIEVNAELENLKLALFDAFNSLKKGGRLVVITFHSLEDRIVKQLFSDLTRDCICPEGMPICTCNHKAEGKLINKKPIIPSTHELEENTRSKSAKLRIIEKN